jgi:hypothetical protein
MVSYFGYPFGELILRTLPQVLEQKIVHARINDGNQR